MKPFSPSRRSKISFWFLPLVCGLLLCGWVWASPASPLIPLTISSAHESHQFWMELARTNAERQKGLMGRKSLPPNHGMLFLFPRPTEVEMWMKDTPLSLDMIFVAPSQRISQIVTRTAPNSTRIISSQGKVIAVIELPAGTAERTNLAVQDRVRY
ncbi:MAG: DUF192 domain-containing protein [Alphaproteobacteria bacterium]|nr:DUF192 domain-containing protein [Alphaproteobacteria bacterium]